jgi:hypothetical protein
LVAPVVSFGVDVVAAEDVMRGFADDVTVWVVTRIRTGVAAWVRPPPRW